MNPGKSVPAGWSGAPWPAGAFAGGIAAAELHVMSWNIRRRVRHLRRASPDRWKLRAPRIRALLQAEQPALLGVQEALPDQAALIRDALGPGYRSIGYGRGATRKGEACPMFFDARRLELLSWEQRALSNRPSRAGSRSWGNIVPRIAVAATFRDRSTSARFHAINTHFDHLSPRSRLQSARAIGQLGATSPWPSIVMGDLNATARSAALRALLDGHGLVDAWDAAQNFLGEPVGTFASYRAPDAKRPRIDWILVSAPICVRSIGINTRKYAGGWGSDHLPVQAVLRVPGPGDAR